MSEKASSSKERGFLKTWSKFNKFTGGVAVGAGVVLIPYSPEAATVAFGVAAVDFGSSAVIESFRKWRNKAKQPDIKPA